MGQGGVSIFGQCSKHTCTEGKLEQEQKVPCFIDVLARRSYLRAARMLRKLSVRVRFPRGLCKYSIVLISDV